MDYIKTTQRNEQLTRFLDGVQSVRTSPFGENKSGDRMYRRAERLVAAVHLLTNHVPASEPLRRSVRKASLDLLSNTIEVRDEMRSSGSYKVQEFQAQIRHIISMLRILAISGFVSLQNADVVTEALDDLGSFLVISQKSPFSENIRFSKEDLLDVQNRSSSFKKDIKDTQNKKDSEDKDATDGAKRTSLGVTDRANIILNILSPGGEMGIRDVAAQVPEYSEKMIQRELLDLVQRGLVKKSGLKRWSKYSASDM
ncbi:hypothetical protein FJY93_04400 [Candidatus Kaiserbacteria bacterium]|nr:hypothetical protein [Candidatus Kaiserbacteria bacterium]